MTTTLFPYRSHGSSSAHSRNSWDKGCNANAAQRKPRSSGLPLAASHHAAGPAPGGAPRHGQGPPRAPLFTAQPSASSQTPAPHSISVSDGDAVLPFLLSPTLPPPAIFLHLTARSHGGLARRRNPHWACPAPRDRKAACGGHEGRPGGPQGRVAAEEEAAAGDGRGGNGTEKRRERRRLRAPPSPPPGR